MRNVLAALAVACWAWAMPVTEAAAGSAAESPAGAESLYAEFDPAGLDPAERRFLEAALAASGDLAATPDADWDAASGEALAAYVARGFGDRPRNLHAAALAIGFLARIDAEGWELRHDADWHSARPARGAHGRARAGGGRHPTLGRRRGADGADAWLLRPGRCRLARRRRDHQRRSRGAGDPPRGRAPRHPRQARRRAGLLHPLGSGRRHLGDGLSRGGGGGPRPSQLIAASIAPGAALPWDLPATGRVAAFLDATVDLLYAVAGDLPIRAPAPAMPSAAGSTGTGFFVAERVLVTASHVVGACARVALADGTELRRLGADPALDVAAFASPAPSPSWFTLSPAPRARLGQRVHAAGFPYYSIVGTALHLTGGNVSALAGVNDDARFFSFTAPVQPGNSGGPLIDAEGRVMGLVVSRLSENYIVEETGSLPQNMNYALGSAELAAFLDRIGATRRGDGLGPFDMDAGMPEGFDRAVVPVICLAEADRAAD